MTELDPSNRLPDVPFEEFRSLDLRVGALSILPRFARLETPQ
jgi:hypothetical protein